jgi:transcription antitermination factor NusG
MHLDSFDGEWCAVNVRYQHEFKAAQFLAESGYEVFAPSHTTRRRWSDRWKEIQLPLFAGYIFCRIKASGTTSILRTHGVIRILTTGKTPSIIPEDEIRAIQAAVQSGYNIQPCDYVEIGSRVRISGGPFDGIEGIVESHRNHNRLVLSVELIRGSVVVDLGDYVPLPAPQSPGSIECAA